MSEEPKSAAIEALDELVTKHTSSNVPEINRLQNIVRDQLIAAGKALDLACGMLILHEPGDSRAVSDEFVALACSLSGDIDEKVIVCIDQGLERLRLRITQEAKPND